MLHNTVADGEILTKTEIRDFVDYVKAFGIAVIPEIQSLGHVPWLTHAHREIAEIDSASENNSVDIRLEDARPEKFYPHCYCPSNPRSYEILFEILDEVLELFYDSEYIHMGHDEVYDIGICEACRKKDPAQIYADDVNKIYSYLKSKGRKMMIWCDMLQPVTKYRTPPAIDMIPKDIIMLDFIWYFHLDKDIEDNIISKGFNVIIGNLYSSHFTRYNQRIDKAGVIGAQTSGWVAIEPKALACEGKFFDFLLTAEMMWDENYLPEHSLTYEKAVKNIMPQLRQNLENFVFPSRVTGAKTKLVFNANISFPPAHNTERAQEITIDQKGSGIVIYHTNLRNVVRKPWSEAEIIGNYILTFEDGERISIEIGNGREIGYWNRRQYQVNKNSMYRHSGYTTVYFCQGLESKTSDGSDVCIYRVEYSLPKDKVLKSIKLAENKLTDARIAICKVEIVE